jgi:ADP-heptose:LPS heptosyltransferase
MMREMDLIITSDTATLHLAGSLGLPTWAVLHWDPFWVWGHSDDTSEWYPDVRLFRQKTALEWGPVMKDVQRALLTHLGSV